MTPSLPVPDDDFPEEPGGSDAEVAPVEPAPIKRPLSKPPAKKPRAKKPPKKPTDAGPPPPLPSDIEVAEIVIPPKPPLPEPVVENVDVAAEAVEVAEEPVEVADEPVEVDAAPAEVVEEPAEVVEEPVEVVEEPAVPEVPVIAAADIVAPALVLRGIRKSFGDTRAVDGIDLTVPPGTFYGIVGPNGAGKTTMLSMIAGLLRPDRGTIVVNGLDARAHPLAAKRLMGVLPDRLRTFDRLTGRQLLYYYGVLRGLRSSVVESRTADLARAFDLTDALGRAVSDYSAGMVKKVMLAGAMIHSPRLLVLDEPFEAVDPVSSAVILDILSAYVAHGGTVILSSHGMDLVERVCSRVAVIVAGQVLAEGTVDDVRGELTLEQRFIELAGGLSDVEGLEWLHTFSD